MEVVYIQAFQANERSYSARSMKMGPLLPTTFSSYYSLNVQRKHLSNMLYNIYYTKMWLFKSTHLISDHCGNICINMSISKNFVP